MDSKIIRFPTKFTPAEPPASQGDLMATQMMIAELSEEVLLLSQTVRKLLMLLQKREDKNG
jgi:hypothetical protein